MSNDPSSYVQGVPVKISEKYRPPRKVTLSSKCNYQVDVEPLTIEYDTTLEQESLKWLQNMKQYKENKIQTRREKIRQYDEEKERQEIKLEEEKQRKIAEERAVEEAKQKEIEKEEIRLKQELDEKKKRIEEQENLKQEIELEEKNKSEKLKQELKIQEKEQEKIENRANLSEDKEINVNKVDKDQIQCHVQTAEIITESNSTKKSLEQYSSADVLGNVIDDLEEVIIESESTNFSDSDELKNKSLVDQRSDKNSKMHDVSYIENRPDILNVDTKSKNEKLPIFSPNTLSTETLNNVSAMNHNVTSTNNSFKPDPSHFQGTAPIVYSAPYSYAGQDAIMPVSQYSNVLLPIHTSSLNNQNTITVCNLMTSNSHPLNVASKIVNTSNSAPSNKILENTSNPKINFADFEADSTDPFDSVALKSINDMKELAEVLENTSMKSENYPNFPNNFQTGVSQTYPYMNSYPYTQTPKNNFNNTYNYNQHMDSVVSPNSVIGNVSVENPGYNPSFTQWNNVQNMNYSYQISQPFTANNLAQSYGTQSKTAYENQNNCNSIQSNIKFNQIQPNTVHSNHIQSNSTNSTEQFNLGSINYPINPIEKRQDLEDFYSRYYSSKANSGLKNTSSRSGENTPISPDYMINHSCKELSSSNSVPDLTGSDEEVSYYTNKSRIGNNDTASTSRPSSSSLEIKSRSRSSSGNRLKRLSDPFTELTADAQILVQNMTEMGFPRPRVARAIQKLGTDHKKSSFLKKIRNFVPGRSVSPTAKPKETVKLLEVLLVLQSFEDNGNNEYLAEKAFYYFMGDVDKVKEFLSPAEELLKFGFDEDKIIQVLFKHGNNKEKCIEELTA